MTNHLDSSTNPHNHFYLDSGPSARPYLIWSTSFLSREHRTSRRGAFRLGLNKKNPNYGIHQFLPFMFSEKKMPRIVSSGRVAVQGLNSASGSPKRRFREFQKGRARTLLQTDLHSMIRFATREPKEGVDRTSARLG